MRISQWDIVLKYPFRKAMERAGESSHAFVPVSACPYYFNFPLSIFYYLPWQNRKREGEIFKTVHSNVNKLLFHLIVYQYHYSISMLMKKQIEQMHTKIQTESPTLWLYMKTLLFLKAFWNFPQNISWKIWHQHIAWRLLFFTLSLWLQDCKFRHSALI